MPKIPEEKINQINQIKQNISIIEIAKSYHLKLKRQGKDYITHFPWHDDKTPSLIFTPKTNLYNCMGACNEGGNVIQFVMKMDNISFVEAYNKLAEQSEPTPVKSEPPKETDSSVVVSLLEPEIQELTQTILKHYHQALLKKPNALKYLESRGLNDPDLIKHFNIGCADRGLPSTLPA